MNSQKILDSLNEVREEFIAEAAPAKLRKKIRWKGGVIAACICLLVLGGAVLVHSGEESASASVAESLPMISLPSYESGSMGFEGRLYRSPEELENGNPWKESEHPSALPVYRNGSYDPAGTGEPQGLSEKAMQKRLKECAKALGTKIVNTETLGRTSMETGESGGRENGEEKILEIRGTTEKGEIAVSADGTVTVSVSLAEGSSDAMSLQDADHMSEEHAISAMVELLDTYRRLLGFQHLRILLTGEYSYQGEYRRSFFVYEETGDEVQNILNYNFRRAQFIPDAEGTRLTIRIEDGLAAAEEMGEYPMIAQKDAEARLLDGAYQSSVPAEFGVPEGDRVAKAELVYRTGAFEETYLPYYRFWVEIPAQDGWDWAPGLHMYGAYYVPAVQEEYLSEVPVYDGSFQ